MLNNIRRIDAHLHTLFSDGKLSVPQLIERCKEHGVKVMAITDHDTVKGVISWKSCAQTDIIVIPGIEVSAYSEKQLQIHITGYFPKSADFVKMKEYLSSHVKEIRENRCKTILQRLASDGILIPYSEIEEMTKDRYPSLPIIAECLLNHHYITNSREAYDKYLGSSTKYYEPVRLFTIQEAIDFIHQHHGVACLAHPWLCDNPMDTCLDCLNHGIDGMECFPPKHHKDYGTSLFVDFAKEHSLFCSSGSDFHYTENMEVDVGENIFPEEKADAFVDALKKHNII